ncbi:MAG TPA: hypothetical protein VFI53_11465 [Myxococcaceae bacterium]|nr:hypothetical protein [Myxococcaceae bacterium]
MSHDVDIDAWLSTEGFDLPEGRARAREALETAGLTRAGKARMSAAKEERARAVLDEQLFKHCATPACVAAAARSGRSPVRTAHRTACVSCGGSDNRRAEEALLAACERAGIRRLGIVGGSPSVREELRDALSPRLELRLVDGTERRTLNQARLDLEWADLMLLWGGSELDHRVSTLYTGAAPALRRKLVHTSKRGIAALLEAAVVHLSRHG